MKVFISWSGELSHAVAQVLRDWVGSVLQAAKPWLSSADIERGALWMGDIGAQLHESTVGIFCLTGNNKNAPWILFEAGAVAKGVASSRICTLLIDLEPTAVLGPLSQFNHTKPTKSDMFKLASTLNLALGDGRLSDSGLRRSFDAHWPQFEQEFNHAVATNPEPQGAAPAPNANDLLTEILASVRSLGSRVQQMEERAVRLSPQMAYPFPSDQSTAEPIPRWARPIASNFANEERARMEAAARSAQAGALQSVVSPTGRRRGLSAEKESGKIFPE
ncbi:toll/interleukin-1 receptor domain-containing protein [Variovorax boronicumulans]|uniref:toll/interleukin-1 receptor domain-containing protein n=1 Tax=Variovorax boronicumulans TaxID=436515 RepID=UPI001C59C238